MQGCQLGCFKKKKIPKMEVKEKVIQIKAENSHH